MPVCGLARNDSSNEGGMTERRYSLQVAMVEGEATTVARGSGSEAVAESCGGTVFLTDNGTRERRLREEHEANSRQSIARRGNPKP